MKKGTDNKLLIGVALIVVGAGGGATYFMYNLSQSARDRVDQLQAEVPKEEELRKQLADSEKKVAEYRFQLNHLERGIPNIAYVPTLLTELENLGVTSKMAVTGVRPVIENKSAQKSADAPGTKRSKKSYEEISIDITGRGSYGHVLEMVSALQKFPKIVSVQTMSLTPKRDANNLGGQPKLETTVRIKAYAFADNKDEVAKGAAKGASVAKETPAS